MRAYEPKKLFDSRFVEVSHKTNPYKALSELLELVRKTVIDRRLPFPIETKFGFNIRIVITVSEMATASTKQEYKEY